MRALYSWGILLKVITGMALGWSACSLLADELPAALQPIALKYQNSLDLLSTQCDAAMQPAFQLYARALTNVETSAINAGQLAAIAAITREREAVESKDLPPAFPAGLPGALQASRKTLLDTLARINTEAVVRRNKINLEYIRGLTALQAAATPEVSKAINAEKLRIIALAPTAPIAAAPLSIGPAKPLNELVQIVPFSYGTFKEKAKPGSDIPDELKVTVNGMRIEFSGTKTEDLVRLNGILYDHNGKLALISAGAPESGTLSFSEPPAHDGTYYALAFELPDNKLESTKLETVTVGTTYKWTLQKEVGNMVLKVTHAGQMVATLTAPADQMRAFGFLSTARYIGNKSGMVVTVNASAAIK